MVECVEGAQPNNFSEHINAAKTFSFPLQRRNRAVPVGDEESSGNPTASTFLALAVLIGQVLFSGVSSYLPFS
jgi:hypothetical protein